MKPLTLEEYWDKFRNRICPNNKTCEYAISSCYHGFKDYTQCRFYDDKPEKNEDSRSKN